MYSLNATKHQDRAPAMPDYGMRLLLIYGVPLSFCFLIFAQSFDLASSGYVIVTYTCMIFISMMAGLTFIYWIRFANNEVKAIVYMLLFFFVAYIVGIFIAEEVPTVAEIRRHLVSNFWPATYIIILLLTPKKLSKLHRNMELVLIFFGLVGIQNLVTEFMAGNINNDRLAGFFSQPNIAATWVIAGLIIWRERIKEFHFEIPIIPILSLIFGIMSTFAVLLTGSFLGIFQIIIVWIYTIIDSVPSRLQVVTFIFLCLSVLGFWTFLQNASFSGDIINYRMTSLINTIQSPEDTTELDQNSSFSARWGATEAGMKEMPDTLIIGRGLGNDAVAFSYTQGLKLRTTRISVHNVVIHTWLTSGGIAGIIYTIFLWYLIKYIWVIKQMLSVKRGGFIVILILTIVSTTQPFNMSMVPATLAIIVTIRRYELSAMYDLKPSSTQQGEQHPYISGTFLN